MNKRTGIKRIAVGLLAIATTTMFSTAAGPQAPRLQAGVDVQPAVSNVVAVTGIPSPLPTSECLANVRHPLLLAATVPHGVQP